MAVRAKFRCNSVSQPYEINQHLADTSEVGKRMVTDINLSAVSGGSDENKDFFASTPNGQVNLSTVNPAASDYFKQGKEYYLDFTEVK